ncbi:acyl-CoA dehydrogenase family protein, partial [Thermodesulfobacteriota bacterium]
MDFECTNEEIALIEEIRAFIKKESTPDLVAETRELEGIYGGPLGRKFIKKFAANGWLAPSWPKKYGGLESSDMVTYMIRNELPYAGVPCDFTGAHLAGPTILRFGSEEMKDEYLLPTARGEIEFCLGYTEPEAGSDLMGLKMKAEDKG